MRVSGTKHRDWPETWSRSFRAALRTGASLVRSTARGLRAWTNEPAALPLNGYTPSQPIFGVDHLSDEDLNALNALLPWNCFVADGHGRRFGGRASRTKRNNPQDIPDRRILWLNSRLPLKDLTVLEVGCFEGIHTVALCRFAAAVKACDGRVVNVAKTAVRSAMFNVHPELVVWNVETPVPPSFDPSCDILHHVGVLYHLEDPVRHLERVALYARVGILLDTHYATDEEAVDAYTAGNREYRFKRYLEGGKADPFSGMHSFARWLRLGDIVSLLGRLGFSKAEVVEVRQERNGPRCLIFAMR